MLIFDHFSILRIFKNTAPADDFEDLCICFMIALETDLGPILVRFWAPKSFQNRSQESPERCWKSLSFLHVFGNLQKSIFWPTWPQLGPNLAPKTIPSWSQNWSKIGPKTVSEARSAPEPILERFLIDFDRFWRDFWYDFSLIFVNF